METTEIIFLSTSCALFKDALELPNVSFPNEWFIQLLDYIAPMKKETVSWDYVQAEFAWPEGIIDN